MSTDRGDPEGGEPQDDEKRDEGAAPNESRRDFVKVGAPLLVLTYVVTVLVAPSP